MKVISHRAYLDGESNLFENNPNQIKRLLKMGVDVEIDVWCINEEYFLGHHDPRYRIEEPFLKQEGLWCHAKNKDALERMLSSDVHCFWHQVDDYTITSRGYIWAYPSKETSGTNTVLLFPERFPNINYSKYDFICTDYVNKFLNKTYTSNV